MAPTQRFGALLLVLLVAIATPEAAAKKHGRGHGHGHGKHNGWVQSRTYSLRTWVQRVTRAAPQNRDPGIGREAARARDAADRRAAALAEEARRAQRRREEVAAFVRAHPPIAMR